MNFFERQEAARRTSTRLVVLFALAVLGIVAAVDFVVWSTVGSGALVASTDAASDADRQRVAEIEAALRDESPPGSIESAAAPR